MSEKEQPLSLRIGSIRHQLDDRSDGTGPGYRAIIQRDLRRHWHIMETFCPTIPRQDARRLLDEINAAPTYATDIIGDYLNDVVLGPHIETYAIADALERAGILTTLYSMPADEALTIVRLLKG